MLKSYDIYFESNPLIEEVLSKMSAHSGLDVEAVIEDNGTLSLTHPTSPRHSIYLNFVKKGSYHGGEIIIERNHVSVNSFTPEINYLEGVALAVLKDLGGQTKFSITLPAWTQSKWLGDIWWKKVGSKPTFLARLIEKIILAPSK